MSALTALSCLTLENFNFSGGGPQELSGLTGLRSMSLAYDLLHDLPAGTLLPPNLTSLNLAAHFFAEVCTKHLLQPSF